VSKLKKRVERLEKQVKQLQCSHIYKPTPANFCTYDWQRRTLKCALCGHVKPVTKREYYKKLVIIKKSELANAECRVHTS